VAINHNSGSTQNDAVSMVANQLHVDLSATIKPDLNKGAGAVGAAMVETGDKLGSIQQIEQSLHQQLGDKTGGGTAGPKGRLSAGQAMGFLGMLGFATPTNGDPITPAPAQIKMPGIHQHAAEVIGGPSSFKTSSSSSKKGKDEEPSVYQDAMGGNWNFKTGFEVTPTTRQQPVMSPQQARELQMASSNTINTLGADAVREDLGQIGEAKKRLGQQGQQALDDAEKLGVGVDQKLALKPFAPGGARPAGLGMG